MTSAFTAFFNFSGNSFEKDLFLMAGNIVTVLEECASESKVKISLISELKNVTIFHSDVIIYKNT